MYQIENLYLLNLISVNIAINICISSYNFFYEKYRIYIKNKNATTIQRWYRKLLRECIICKNNFIKNSSKPRKVCINSKCKSHSLICYKCINKWLQDNKKCAYCRSNVKYNEKQSGKELVLIINYYKSEYFKLRSKLKYLDQLENILYLKQSELKRKEEEINELRERINIQDSINTKKAQFLDYKERKMLRLINNIENRIDNVISMDIDDYNYDFYQST